MITIWSALAGESDVVWRGIVETGDGHRHYFHTPDGLLQLLAQLCDWPDIAT